MSVTEDYDSECVSTVSILADISIAIEENDRDEVKRILEGIKNINQVDLSDHTTLMYASKFGHADVVQLFLNKGADVNQAEILDGWTALMYAIDEGFVEIVRLLLKNGADVNQPDNNGGSCLMLASFKGNIDIIILLLKNGAKVNHTDKNGSTALRLAKDFRHSKIAEVLEQHGAV
ncbi:MAG: ankyrin repeat domain-containing protein [Hydrotalea sp.]|nr:ankyrin repeat domain-containing protein [Hydrotalea sp.]